MVAIDDVDVDNDDGSDNDDDENDDGDDYSCNSVKFQFRTSRFCMVINLDSTYR